MAMKSTSSSDSLIRIDDLTKIYQDSIEEQSVTAIKDIDLSVGNGEFLSIVGPSGCGKSTFLRIISGLLDPTHGGVYLDGQEVTGPLSDIGFVFQSPVLMDWRTVRKNVMFPYEALKSNGNIEKSKEFYDQRAEDLLNLVGLEDFTDAYPRQLSGGMQQRVAICRALLPDPSILLMDEPFGALDEFKRDKLNRELLDIWGETNKTILFVTHDIQEAVYLSDRVLVLSARPGEIQAIEKVDINRPRQLNVRDTPAFFEHVSNVRKVIGIYES